MTLPASNTFWAAASILTGLGIAVSMAYGPRERASAPPVEMDRLSLLGPAYVGDAVCAECHQRQAQAHEQSGHAHTFFTEDLCDRYAKLLGQEISDPERPVKFRFECVDQKLVAAATLNGETRRLPIQFGVGSGTHATTFLTLLESPKGEPTAIEHRLSLFDRDSKIDLTPSQSGHEIEAPIDCFGRVKRGRDVVRCVECHSTTGNVQGTSVSDLRANVNCERCHGPGRTHLIAVANRSADRAIKYAPSKASAAEEVNLCGQCHRLPEALNTLPDPDDMKLARFQPVGLMQSACYRRSEGELRCSTCHDPHAPVNRESNSYNNRCQDCHSRKHATRSNCPVEPSGDCVACHMPSREVHPGIRFHDHWIRRPSQ